MKINTNRLKSMKPMKIDENQRKPIENQWKSMHKSMQNRCKTESLDCVA
jgi:hypothetical protein